MVYAPETQQGSFFNDQEREVTSVQWVETLSLSLDRWRGQHLFKFGLDFQDSQYDGTSASRPVEIRRLDGSLAERIVPGAAIDAGGHGRRARDVRAGSLADRLARDAGARPPHGSRGRRRARELVAARRRVGRRAARRPRHSPRRRRANSASGRRSTSARSGSSSRAWSRGSAPTAAARPAGDARQRPGAGPAHARGGRPATSNGTSDSAGACCSRPTT